MTDATDTKPACSYR